MSSDSIEYRSAGTDDFAQVLALLTSAKLPTEGAEDLGDRMIVARSEGRVVGAAGLEVHEADGLLRSVVVANNWRGRGLGRALVEKVMGLAQRDELENVYLLTEDASDYFGRLGFERVDRESITGAVTESAEFSHLCPSSAVAMVSRLTRGRIAGEGVEGNGGDSKR